MPRTLVCVVVSMLAWGCAETPARPMGLPCDDSGPCGSNSVGANSGGGGGGGSDGGVVLTDSGGGGSIDSGETIVVHGTVLGASAVPVGPGTRTVPLSAWTISSVQDPSLAASSVTDGTFTLSDIPTVILAGTGQGFYGLLATSPPGDYLGSYRVYSATATEPIIHAVSQTTLRNALYMAGGAVPDSALGQVIVNVRSSADSTAQGVANILVSTGSALTFYDNATVPGQLFGSATGTGPAGFALVLNVPGALTGTPVTLRLQSSTAGVTVSPSSIETLAFSRAVTWIDVVVTTSTAPSP